MDEVESIATQLNVNYYFSLVAFVVLYYDFILTFPSEIERFWSGGFSWAALLFFINRYLSMLGHVPVILQTFWQTNNEIYSIVLQILFGILLIMRTYALYSRSRLILYIMIVSAFLSIAVACWGITGKHTSPPPITTDIPGCAPTLSDEQGKHLAIAWGAMSVFDTVIFILTAAKALFTPWTSRWGLVRVVVRDGTLYFVILVAINLANILTLLLGAPLIKGVATLFTNIIYTTLVSRLMLNIRDPNLTSSSRGLAMAMASRTYDEGTTTTTGDWGMVDTIVHFGAGAVGREFGGGGWGELGGEDWWGSGVGERGGGGEVGGFGGWELERVGGLEGEGGRERVRWRERDRWRGEGGGSEMGRETGVYYVTS